MSTSTQSILGWQIKLFVIVLIGTLLAEWPTRLLLGSGYGFGDSGSPYWSIGVVITRSVEAILRLLFVGLLIGALAWPRDGDKKPVITNWFSAFALSWIAMDVISTGARLLLSYVQNQQYLACTANNATVTASCMTMPLINIGYAVVAIVSFAAFIALLSLLVKPAETYRVSNDGLLLGALAGGAQAIAGFALVTGGGFLARGDDGGMFFYQWILPLMFALLDALALAITLGLWRQSLSGGASPIATRFD